MNYSLDKQISHPFPLRLDIGSDTGLFRGKAELILILWICFYFSVKVVGFIRLLPFQKVFALFFMQSDKRKPTAGLFKLHRLLYFTRAVCLPTPTKLQSRSEGK